jgi:RimJ/RimL family protein N-acetyltransferase
LSGCDPLSLLGSNHKRNVKKAQKAGVNIRRTREKMEWLSEHTALMSHSAQRRIARGESISVDADTKPYRALMQNGAAELFQAVLGENVLSSVLVLQSARTGYYQSAGSSPEGMNMGASHFLISGIAGVLRQEGRQTFNLGGAAEGSSLARFKLGFGPEIIALSEAVCYVGPKWKTKLRSAIRLMRSDRQRLVSILTGSSSRMLVFRVETAAAPAPVPPIPDAQLEPLNEDQLAALPCPVDDPDFRDRQMERLRRFGKSYAYRIRVGDTTAHISWLLPQSAVASDVPTVLALQEGEAEIAGCETAVEFRGKGLYRYAIQCLASLAGDQGIRRIYMKTLDTNVASQRGIQKAGLSPIGSVRLIHPPLAPSCTIIRRKLALLSKT